MLSRSIMWDPMDCSLPGSSVHGSFQARILAGHIFLLPGIFPTQGSNPCLLHLLNWKREHLEWKGGLPRWFSSKESACNAADPGSVPGLGQSRGGWLGHILQYSCLKNHMNREAWGATVQRVSKSWTRLKWLSTEWQRGQDLSQFSFIFDDLLQFQKILSLQIWSSRLCPWKLTELQEKLDPIYTSVVNRNYWKKDFFCLDWPFHSEKWARQSQVVAKVPHNALIKSAK